MPKLSVLDLSPVLSGLPCEVALRNSIDLAKYADDLGYFRYWFAEHHSMSGIATTSPEIMISQIGSVTKNIRIGSGGVMLPNHSPLKVAENFKTLEALFPGRVDLGLGRAPGTDTATAIALRRSEARVKADHFPEELNELMEYLGDGRGVIKAMPETLREPEIWLLGSSDFSAKLSAELGLPFSFADHFSPMPAGPIVELYRRGFKPSRHLQKPKVMIGTHIICADTDEEARRLSVSSDYSFYQLRQYGKSVPLISVEEAEANFSMGDINIMRSIGMKKFVGSPQTIKEKLSVLLDETHPDELIITSFIYDHEARKKSYQLVQEVLS